MLAVAESPGIDPLAYARSSQDVTALVGTMALLEGESLAGSLHDRLMRRVGDRFNRVGLLADSFDIDDVQPSMP